MIRFPRLFPITMAAALLFTAPIVRSVTFISTADPTFNTTAPTGALAGSGWQYEASFGPFLATAIGPHHFLTVKHIGVPSNVFVYQGATYTIVNSIDDPGSELRMFEVAETVPTYAPLYSRGDEQGRDIVVIGRGAQRGNPVYLGSSLRGWEWGDSDMVQRWGENQITEANGYTLYATFDQNGKPNEAHLSSGDSGGAVFINDGGGWKLAGISFSVDGPFATTAGGANFNATLFDARGLYDAVGRLISSSGPASSGFYALRVSTQLPWIQSILSPGISLPTPTPATSPSPTPTPASTPTPAPSTGPGRMINPAPASILPSSVATFNWSAGSATSYWLYAGNSLGASDIYDSGTLSVRSLTVNNFPTNGAAVYVRLYSRIGKKWQSIDYNYKTYGSVPSSTPTPPPAASPSPTPVLNPTPTPNDRGERF